MAPRIRGRLVMTNGRKEKNCTHAANGIGRQCLSTRPSSANFRFGSGSREGSRERPRSPGPIYDVPNGLGKQSVSNRRTSPSSKFGTSSRDERRIEVSKRASA